MKRTQLARIMVTVRSAAAVRGLLRVGSATYPCALGRGGIRVLKREGDGATPRGTYPLRMAYVRRDHAPRFATALPLKSTAKSDGWCDAVGDRNYNRFVRHPYRASAEHLWRDDALYDLVVVIGHNDRPRIQGRGSAIFMHLARPGFAPTEGCVALRRSDLLRILPRLGPRTRLHILA